MTVAQAKTKVCPFTFDTEKSNCICSGCMAWEYMREYEGEIFECCGLLKYIEDVNKPLPEDEKQGYCKRIGK